MAVASMCVMSLRNLIRATRSSAVSSFSRCGQIRSMTEVTKNKEEGVNKESNEEKLKADNSETVHMIDKEQHQKLKEEHEALLSDFKDVKDKYMRSLAETENVRQRMRKEVDAAKLFGIQGFCKDLIEVTDILGQAMQSTPKEEITSSNPHLKVLFEGLTLTNAQMLKVFEKHGLVQILPAEGEKFDPFLHEALFEVPTADKENGSVAVIQKVGYKLQDRTIRPALVGVFKSV